MPAAACRRHGASPPFKQQCGLAGGNVMAVRQVDDGDSGLRFGLLRREALLRPSVGGLPTLSTPAG